MTKSKLNPTKRSYFCLPLSFAVTALLSAAPADAQDKAAEVDKIFSWTKPGEPGCAVAASLKGRLVVNRAYGSADLERDVPISPESVFDAGSVTKQFVAAAALLLVEEGRLSLSEDIRKYIPELPDYGRTVTLDHLLTHTSGVRDWTGLLPLVGGNTDALTLVLRQRGLNFAPGDEWSYSNSGYVLLKEIVARVSGTSFSEFTRKRLFEPLGMNSTRYLLDLRDIVKNRALAYEKQGGRWKMAILLDNDRGGGGALLSTVGDLLIWNDALTNGRFGTFVTEKIQEPATLNNGRKLRYARGLFLDDYRGAKVVWHGGSAAGYKTLLGRFPEHGFSVAIMCNSGDGTTRTTFAGRIFDLFVPGGAAQPAEPKTPAESGGAGAAVPGLESKAGLFFSEGAEEPLRLGVDGGKLRIVGGPPLVALTKDHFRNPRGALSFMSQDEFELRFLSPDDFELKSMDGKTTKYRRARPYAPTSADLQAFAGRFESGDVGSVFRIEPKGPGLVIRLDHSPARALPFLPIDTDTFQWSRMIVRFHRDKAGKVVAFDYSNPLVRSVEFTRLSGGPDAR